MSAKTGSNEVSQLFAITAAYYGRRYEDDTLKMFASDLADFPPEEIRRALNEYRRDPKNKTMPLPAQIREILSPKVDNVSLAREIAARCVQAIRLYGWPQAEEARAYIGEEGWSVIRSHGGWTSFCENHGRNIDPTQFMAQARDRILDQLNHGGHRGMEMLCEKLIKQVPEVTMSEKLEHAQKVLDQRDHVLEMLKAKKIEDAFKEKAEVADENRNP